MASSTSDIVFGGLTFRSIDSRKMQELLKHYSSLPSRPTDRRALWANIQILDINLNTEEHYLVQHWYEFGGALPTVRTELQKGASLPTTTPTDTVAESPSTLRPANSFFREARRLGDAEDEEAHNPLSQPPAVRDLGGQVIHDGFRVPSNPYLRRPAIVFNESRRLGEDGEALDIMTSMPDPFSPDLRRGSVGTDGTLGTAGPATESGRMREVGEEPNVTNSIPDLFLPPLPPTEEEMDQILSVAQLESRRLDDGAEEDPTGTLLEAVTAPDHQHHRRAPGNWPRHRRTPARHLRPVTPQPSTFNESRRLGTDNEDGEEANEQSLPTRHPVHGTYTNSPRPVNIGFDHRHPEFHSPLRPGHLFAGHQPGNVLPVDPDRPFNHRSAPQSLINRVGQMHNGPFQLPHIQAPHVQPLRTGLGHFHPIHQDHRNPILPPNHPDHPPFNPHLGHAPSISQNYFMPSPFQGGSGRRLGAEGEEAQEEAEVPRENAVDELPETVHTAPSFGNGSMQLLIDANTIRNSAIRTTAVEHARDQAMEDFDESDNEDQAEVWPQSRARFHLRRPPPPEPIECDICAESRLPSEFPSFKITATCSHETVACFECMRNVISVAIESNNLDNINCPLCPTKLVKANIKRFASADVFNRYVSSFLSIPRLTKTQIRVPSLPPLSP
jgi:hypothetical protein